MSPQYRQRLGQRERLGTVVVSPILRVGDAERVDDRLFGRLNHGGKEGVYGRVLLV